MKRKPIEIFLIVLVILLIAAMVVYYFYEVIIGKTPYTRNLVKSLVVVCSLAATLLKLLNGSVRKGLDFYEKSYEKELGFAFKNEPRQRKKLLRACRFYNEDNYKKALKYLSQLLKEAKFERDTIPVLFFIALCYTDVGMSDEAIHTYYALLKIAPNNAQVHSNLGQLFIAEGDFESALEHYNKSIELDPKNYYAYTNRANFYFGKCEYDNAIADAKRALQYKNNGIEASNLLTIIYALQGDEQNKRNYYHISITSGENPEKLNNAINHFLSEQNIP